jgi:hypothetical protein
VKAHNGSPPASTALHRRDHESGAPKAPAKGSTKVLECRDEQVRRKEEVEVVVRPIEGTNVYLIKTGRLEELLHLAGRALIEKCGVACHFRGFWAQKADEFLLQVRPDKP